MDREILDYVMLMVAWLALVLAGASLLPAVAKPLAFVIGGLMFAGLLLLLIPRIARIVRWA